MLLLLAKTLSVFGPSDILNFRAVKSVYSFTDSTFDVIVLLNFFKTHDYRFLSSLFMISFFKMLNSLFLLEFKG